MLEHNKFLDLLVKSGHLLALKAEFEAEGSTLEDLCFLSNLCIAQNIPLTIKIGGPAAKRDMNEAWQLCASNILVPMVESLESLLYAINSYSHCRPIFQDIVKPPRLLFNVETKSCVDDLPRIVNYLNENPDVVSGIVVGRTDLAASLGYTDPENPDLTKIIIECFNKLSVLPLHITVGGSISSQSFQNLSSFKSFSSFNAFETRKCTLSSSSLDTTSLFHSMVESSLCFERSLLQDSNSNLSKLQDSNLSRVEAINRRYPQ